MTEAQKTALRLADAFLQDQHETIDAILCLHFTEAQNITAQISRHLNELAQDRNSYAHGVSLQLIIDIIEQMWLCFLEFIEKQVSKNAEPFADEIFEMLKNVYRWSRST